MELRDYLSVIRHRRQYIIAAVLIVTISTVLFSLLGEPTYRGEAKVLMTEQEAGNLLAQLQLSSGQNLQTQVNLIKLRPLLEQVIDAENLDTTPEELLERIKVVGIVDTSLITIEVEDSDPTSATATANALANSYVEWSRDLKRESIRAAAEQVEMRLAELEEEVQTLINTQVDEPDAASHQTRVETAVARHAALAGQLEQLRISEQLEAGAASVVSPAAVDDEQVAPNPLRNGVLALVVGLVLGIGVAFVVDYLDNTIGSAEEAESIYGAPVLGQIPAHPNQQEAPRALSVFEHPSSRATESYRVLRNSLDFVNFEHDVKTMIVTSAMPGEGKSTVAANLAAVLSQAGRKTVLVECDFRLPNTHEFFGLAQGAGLSDVLTGALNASEVLKQPERLDNLRILTAGRMPPNPSELLGSATMKRLIGSLAEWADWIIVDTPPLLAVSDAAAVARWADGVILVARAGSTTRDAARSSLEMLNNAGARLIGVVITGKQEDASTRNSYGGYYLPTHSDRDASSD